MTANVVPATWGQTLPIPRSAPKHGGISFWHIVTPLIYLAFFAALMFERPTSVEHLYHGTITVVHPTGLVLRENDEHRGFEIADDALISLDGIPAQVQDLRPGQLAEVVAERVEQKLIAKVIDASRNHQRSKGGQTTSFLNGTRAGFKTPMLAVTACKTPINSSPILATSGF